MPGVQSLLWSGGLHALVRRSIFHMEILIKNFNSYRKIQRLVQLYFNHFLTFNR